MKKLTGCVSDYELLIPGNTNEELATEITSMLDEAVSIDDTRHCFVEWDMAALDGSGRTW